MTTDEILKAIKDGQVNGYVYRQISDKLNELGGVRKPSRFCSKCGRTKKTLTSELCKFCSYVRK